MSNRAPAAAGRRHLGYWEGERLSAAELSHDEWMSMSMVDYVLSNSTHLYRDVLNGSAAAVLHQNSVRGDESIENELPALFLTIGVPVLTSKRAAQSSLTGADRDALLRGTLKNIVVMRVRSELFRCSTPLASYASWRRSKETAPKQTPPVSDAANDTPAHGQQPGARRAKRKKGYALPRQLTATVPSKPGFAYGIDELAWRPEPHEDAGIATADFDVSCLGEGDLVYSPFEMSDEESSEQHIARLLNSVRQHLTPGEFNALWDRLVQRMSVEAIAQAQRNVHPNAVWGRLKSARTKLLKLVRERCGDEVADGLLEEITRSRKPDENPDDQATAQVA